MRTAVCAMGAILLVAAPAGAGPQDRGKQAQPAKAAKPLAVRGFDLDEANLVDVVEYIRKLARVNIVWGRNAAGVRLDRVWPPITVTVAFDDVPWPQALRLVAESAKCLVAREGRVWRVWQPAAVTVNVERGDFRRVVFDLAAQADANLVLGNDVPDGLTVSARLRNVPWPHAIRAVTKAAGMQLVIVGNDLTIGGRHTAASGRPAFNDLRVIVTIQKQHAAVRDLAALIAKAARVKVIVAEGVSKDLKVNLALRDVTHRVALERLARAAGLRLTRDPKRRAWLLTAPPAGPAAARAKQKK